MPVQIKISDHILMPFGCPKWDKDQIQMASVGLDGTYFVSNTKCAYIDKSKKQPLRMCNFTQYFPYADDKFPCIENGKDAFAYAFSVIEQQCELDTSYERKFLQLYCQYFTELFENAWRWATDLDGDSYPDFAVGAIGYGDKYNPQIGRAFVYLGGSQGIVNSPAITLTGSGAYNRFGGSLAGAGDVNNDGFDDLIVAAVFSQSSAYVYLGGPSGLSTTVPITFYESANNFGYSVTSVTNANGDSYSDIAVGAPQSTGPGMVFAYYGDLQDPIAVSWQTYLPVIQR